MQIIIDRFEGDFAVVETENGNTLNVPKELLYFAKEGDIIDILVNVTKTAERKKEVYGLMNELFKD